MFIVWYIFNILNAIKLGINDKVNLMDWLVDVFSSFLFPAFMSDPVFFILATVNSSPLTTRPYLKLISFKMNA